MRLRSLLPFAFLFACSTALAADFAWTGRGTVSLEVPESWSLNSRPMADVSYNFQARPKSGAAAILQITLLNTPADKPVKPEHLSEQLGKMVQSYIAGSVEQKFDPHPLKGNQGTGVMAQFTDASLVAKPPVPGDYKMMRNALVALDDHALAIVTMQFDDPNAPESAQMLAIASSLHFTRQAQAGPPAPAPTPTSTADGLEFTVPESKLLLRFTEKGFVQDRERSGGATDSPGYFSLSRLTNDPEAMLIVSGWFEPAEHYKGLKNFWKSESAGLSGHGLPPPSNITYGKEGAWETVAYDQAIEKGITNTHVRAEMAKTGTWIDLHLSITTSQSASAARQQLVALLKSIQVVEKP